GENFAGALPKPAHNFLQERFMRSRSGPGATCLIGSLRQNCVGLNAGIVRRREANAWLRGTPDGGSELLEFARAYLAGFLLPNVCEFRFQPSVERRLAR